MPQSGSITVSIASTLSSALDLGTSSFPLSYSKSVGFANGTGLGQADLLFSDQRTLGSGANEDIDLAGALTGPLGGTLTFAKLKGLWIYSLPANTVNLTVSRPGSNGVPLFAAAGDALVLKPGNGFLFTDNSAAGVTVTAGTGDLINLLAGAASTVYDIVILGASA
jgi:hypothetical protein